MRRRRAVLGLAAGLAGVALVLAASVSARSEQSTFKAAWIYVGPHNDGGWSQAHDNGPAVRAEDARREGEDDLQGEHPEGPQLAQTVSRASSATATRSSSRRRSGSIDEVAAARSTRTCTSSRRPGRTCRRTWPSTSVPARTRSTSPGMAAGAATKKGKIGYIVPFAIPEVIRHANAFALGAQAMQPEGEGEADLDELVVRPGKEKKAAESLVAAGADVLGQNVDSPRPGQYAQSKGIPWVGYDSDARKFAPTSWLTAAVYNWGPYYLPRVQGRDERHVEVGLLLRRRSRTGSRTSPRTARRSRAKTKALIAAKRKALDQRHVLRVHRPALRPERQAARPEGQDAGIGCRKTTLYAMNWLVKGIIGSAKG